MNERERIALLISTGQATEAQLKQYGPEIVRAIKAETELPQVRNGSASIFDADSFEGGGEVKLVSGVPDGFAFNAEKREIPWIFSDEARDSDGDKIRQKGWDFTRFKKAPRVLWSHDHRMPALGTVVRHKVVKLGDMPSLIGVTQFASVDESVHADTIFRLASPVTPDGRKRQPHISSTSVGFMPTNVNIPETEEEREELGLGMWGVEFLAQSLLELSIVNVGANENAVQLALKGLVDEGQITGEQREEFLRDSPLCERDWAKRYDRMRARSFVSMAGPAEDTNDVSVRSLDEIVADLEDAVLAAKDAAEGAESDQAAEPDTEELTIASALAEVAGALQDLATTQVRIVKVLEKITPSGGDAGGLVPDAESPDARKGRKAKELSEEDAGVVRDALGSLSRLLT